MFFPFFLIFFAFSSEGFRLSFIAMIKSVIAQEIITRQKQKSGSISSTHAGLFSGTVDGPPLANHEKQATPIRYIINQHANTTFKMPMEIFTRVLLLMASSPASDPEPEMLSNFITIRGYYSTENAPDDGRIKILRAMPRRGECALA